MTTVKLLSLFVWQISVLWGARNKAAETDHYFFDVECNNSRVIRWLRLNMHGNESFAFGFPTIAIVVGIEGAHITRQ
jgi:hypothetical protein